MTLKEQMAAKKQAKKARINKQLIEYANRENQKRQRKGLQDFIPMTEWATSSYALYFDSFKSKLEDNSLLIHHLISEFPQLHRMTFWNTEYDLTGIRKIIEGTFDKHLLDDDVETVQLKAYNPVKIHYKQRELLLNFVKTMYSIICKYKSRRAFAYDNAEMINNHHLYCGLAKVTVHKFCDWEGVSEARTLIEERVNCKADYLKTKNELKEMEIMI